GLIRATRLVAGYAATGGAGGEEGLLPLSSGWSSSLSAGSRQRQSERVNGARPWAMRARSHCELATPNSQEASTSRHTDGRLGWMLQREYTPISASSATQRIGGASVPCMHSRCVSRRSVSAAGT